MSTGYAVRPHRPGDEEGIVQLLELVFDGWPQIDIPGSPLDYWRWKHGSKLNESICSVCEHDGQIVGCHHMKPLKIKVLDETVLGATSMDLAVHPDHRRLGFLNQLRDLSVGSAKKAGIKFTYYITGNPVMIKRLSRLGRPFPHPMANLVRIKDVDRQLKAIPVNNAWAMKLGFQMSKLMNDLKNLYRKSEPLKKEFEISQIDGFDEGINAFWEKTSSHYDYIVERDKDYLNWKYCDPRTGDYVIKGVLEEGCLLGYVVLRINRYRKDYPVGYVVDLLVLPNRNDAAAALIEDSIRYFDDQKINIVNYQVVSVHPYEQLFKNQGFLKSNIDFHFFYVPFGGKDDIQISDRIIPEKFFSSWGDHDVLPVSMPRYE